MEKIKMPIIGAANFKLLNRKVKFDSSERDADFARDFIQRKNVSREEEYFCRVLVGINLLKYGMYSKAGQRFTMAGYLFAGEMALQAEILCALAKALEGRRADALKDLSQIEGRLMEADALLAGVLKNGIEIIRAFINGTEIPEPYNKAPIIATISI